MKNTEKISKILVQKGLMFGLSIPLEFAQALKTKFKELAEKSNDKQRWLDLSEGFEMGLEQQLQARKQTLAKTKKGRSKTQGRTR